MAARKTKHLSDEWRQKIQASMLINRLTGFVNGEFELTAPQVTAALGLLKKALPDLAAVELSSDPENPVRVQDVTADILSAVPTERLQEILAARDADRSSNIH